MLRHVRYAVRGLLRNPGFAIAAILTLAVGIAAVTSIFSVTDAVMLRPLPFPQQDRLVVVWDQLRKLKLERFTLSTDTFELYQRQNVFDAAAAFFQFDRTMTFQGRTEMVPAMFVSDGLLPLVGADPILGRSFAPDEYEPANSAKVILSHAFFERRFGGDRSIVGQSIAIDGKPHTVIGVMRPGFAFSIRVAGADLWTPFDIKNRRWEILNMIARLRPGVSLEAAQAALDAAARQYNDEKHPHRGPRGEDPGFG
jgi:hypothetical protein